MTLGGERERRELNSLTFEVNSPKYLELNLA